jgi:hypothetical protein
MSNSRPPVTPQPARVVDLRANSKSTPSRTSLSSTLAIKHTKDSVDPLVKKEMEEFTVNVTVDTWVSAVCGVNQTKLASWAAFIEKNSWIEDNVIANALTDFCTATEEVLRYEPLCTLTLRLLELVQEANGGLDGLDGPPPVKDMLFYRSDRRPMRRNEDHGNLAAKRKPDVLATRKGEQKLVQDEPTVEWAKVLHYIEVKYELRARSTLISQLNTKLGRPAQSEVKAFPPSITYTASSTLIHYCLSFRQI